MKRIGTAMIAIIMTVTVFAQNNYAKKDFGQSAGRQASVVPLSRVGTMQANESVQKCIEFESAPGLHKAPMKAGADYSQPVIPSENVASSAEEWYMRGKNWYFQTAISRMVNVAFDGDDVYIQGLFYGEYDSSREEYWVKATIDNGKLVFPTFTYMGVYNGTPLYFTHLNFTSEMTFISFGAPEATYDDATKTIEFTNDCSVNCGDERAYLMSESGIAALSRLTKDAPDADFCNVGDPIELPYVNDFSTNSRFSEFGIINLNQDDAMWQYRVGTLHYSDNGKPADDWAISPAAYLEKGKTYSLSFDACVSSEKQQRPVTVWMGKQPKAAAMETKIIDHNITASEHLYQTERVANEKIEVSEDGYYHFGIHVQGDANPDLKGYFVRVDNFTLESLDGYPNPVEDLLLIPDANGENKAQLTFTFPTTTRDGSEFPEGTYLTAYLNDKAILQEKPGTVIRPYNIEVNRSGEYTYSVEIQYEQKRSPAVSVTGYIGIDIPNSVENFSVNAVYDGVKFAWSEPGQTGMHGAVVKPEEVVYDIYNVVDLVPGYGYYELQDRIGKDLTGTEWKYDTEVVNSVEQDEYIYGIIARNSAGQTNSVLNTAYYGKPYEMPFCETFTGNSMWSKVYITYGGEIVPKISYTTKASDGDHSALEVYLGGESNFTMQFGRVSLEKAEKPFFICEMYSEIPGSTAQFIAVTPDNEKILLDKADLSLDGYAQYVIDLAPVANQKFIRMFVTVDTPEDGFVYMDNFNITNLTSDDLSIAIEAPASAVTGSSVAVTAIVKNKGLNTATDFKVRIYADDEIVKEFEGDYVATAESQTYTATYKPSVFSEEGIALLKAEVEFAADNNLENNVAEANINITKSKRMPVRNLSGTCDTDGSVVLKWDAPDNPEVEFDDFEDYEYGIYSDGKKLGEWTVRDLDKGYPASWASGSVDWPWEHGETYGCAIVDFDRMNLGNYCKSYSGNQCLMFMCVYRQDPANPDNFSGILADKWLISPELDGDAVELSFFYRAMTSTNGAENIAILYSTTGNNPEDFKTFEDLEIANEEWYEYSTVLPVGTKYFAFHYTSSSSQFCMFLDDITYGVPSNAPTGYNVYVNQQLLSKLNRNTKTYTYDVSDEENLIFSVTADYNGVESSPEFFNLKTVGIENVIGGESEFDIYTIDGICIKDNALNLNGLIPGVYLLRTDKSVHKIIINK